MIEWIGDTDPRRRRARDRGRLFAETPLVFAAGVIAWRHPAAGGPRFDGRWLALSFWALTVLGVGHLLVLMQGHGASLPLFALWVGATPALFGVHIAAAAAWLNRAVERARDELEVRIAERTRELAAANASLRASEERWRGVSQLGSDSPSHSASKPTTAPRASGSPTRSSR